MRELRAEAGNMQRNNHPTILERRLDEEGRGIRRGVRGWAKGVGMIRAKQRRHLGLLAGEFIETNHGRGPAKCTQRYGRWLRKHDPRIGSIRFSIEQYR